MAKAKTTTAKSGSSLPTPENREELFLAKAAGESVTIPTYNNDRKEIFLRAIANKTDLPAYDETTPNSFLFYSHSDGTLFWSGVNETLSVMRVNYDESISDTFYQLVNYLVQYAVTSNKNKASVTIPAELSSMWVSFISELDTHLYVKFISTYGNFTGIIASKYFVSNDVITVHVPDQMSAVSGWGITAIECSPTTLSVLVHSIDEVTAPFPAA